MDLLTGEGEGEGDFLSMAAKKYFGLEYLFPYQRLVISNILEAFAARETPPEGEAAGDEDRAAVGRQIVILPTGAGKSLCFQLPAMLIRGATLVLYPILSLMADQARRLEARGFAPAVLRGGQSDEERRGIFARVRGGAGDGGSRVIIANPEVLLSERMMRALPALGIAHVVIDEAHCVAEWGESFRPAYLRIAEIIAAAGAGGRPPLVTAFTATAGAPVLEKIERYVFGAGAGGGAGGVHRVIGNPDRPNIAYAAQGALVKDLAVRDLLLANRRPAIVFCSSRAGTERLARCLGRRFPGAVRFYHAGLGREEKTAVERWFFDGAGILAATCAYGMGVDKSDIRTVIHRDPPPSAEAYLQESGRAGRDGLPSRAILLWGPDDELARRRAQGEAGRARVRALLEYARGTERCRREALLGMMNYLPPGGRPETPGGAACCDVCAGAASPLYREEAALRGFFRRGRRCWTLDDAVRILTEPRGPGPGWDDLEARHAVSSLLALGKLKAGKRFPWKGRLSV